MQIIFGKSTKLSVKPLFLIHAVFVLAFTFSACNSTKQIIYSSPVQKVIGSTIYFKNGKTQKLASNKAKSPTMIYLVRHAEKANDGTKDPGLIPQGVERSKRLKNILEKATINQIYSTNYKRTRLTGQPLADLLQLPINDYNPRDLSSFAQKVKSQHKGQSILIVGHSNTTPDLINALMGNQQFSHLTEKEYSHLFIVSIPPKKKPKVLDLQF